MSDFNQTMRQLFHRPLVRRTTILSILLVAAGIAGVLSFGLVRNIVLGRGLAGGRTPQISEEQATAQALDPLSAPSTPNPNAPSSQPDLTPWDGVSRVTVLLIGLDYRDWQSGEGASRSDTMILLTLDPLTKTAGMLSIPRDMWVAIPGFQHGKINTAYYLGEAYKLPGGGPGLAVKTVEQFLGVPVNYYAQIDFAAFVKFIDELGGVKIDVPAKITIDLLGSGSSTKKNLQPGVQVLPGEWALAYARNRYTEGGDFDRAQRQQQVILGIRDRILSLDMLPTLIQKAPSMYQELSSGVHTNLALDQVVKLALLAKDVPMDSIKQGVLNEKYVLFGSSPDGLSIVIPLPDKIHTLRDEIFATSGSLSPQTPGDNTSRMQAETASVAIYNGSGTGGLENQTAELLRTQGMNVVSSGVAGERYASTTVVDHTGNPFTLRYLVDLMGISEYRIQLAYDPSSPVGVELFLGDDWAQKIP
jgi:LCP family protein required for cell wall assembly